MYSYAEGSRGRSVRFLDLHDSIGFTIAGAELSIHTLFTGFFCFIIRMSAFMGRVARAAALPPCYCSILLKFPTHIAICVLQSQGPLDQSQHGQGRSRRRASSIKWSPGRRTNVLSIAVTCKYDAIPCWSTGTVTVVGGGWFGCSWLGPVSSVTCRIEQYRHRAWMGGKGGKGSLGRALSRERRGH